MKLTTLETIFSALNKADVRYLVAGGIAVNIHGYQRMTADLDLVLQLNTDNIQKAMKALNSLGYKPMLPVTGEQFADTGTRQSWINEKNMQVFCMISSAHPETSVDIFVSEPFDFETEYQNATHAELSPEIALRIVSIPALIKMKQQAGRPRDLDDIEHLQFILDENNG